MDGQSIIIILILGALAGWLAGMVFQGGGLGLIGNIVIGILGGFVAYWLLPKLKYDGKRILEIHTGTPWLDYVLTAAIGALILLIVINLIFGRSRRD